MIHLRYLFIGDLVQKFIHPVMRLGLGVIAHIPDLVFIRIQLVHNAEALIHVFIIYAAVPLDEDADLALRKIPLFGGKLLGIDAVSQHSAPAAHNPPPASFGTI